MTAMCALWRRVQVMLNCFGSYHVPVSRQCLKSRTFSLCLSLVSSRPNPKCTGSSHVSIFLSCPVSLSRKKCLDSIIGYTYIWCVSLYFACHQVHADCRSLFLIQTQEEARDRFMYEIWDIALPMADIILWRSHRILKLLMWSFHSPNKMRICTPNFIEIGRFAAEIYM